MFKVNNKDTENTEPCKLLGKQWKDGNFIRNHLEENFQHKCAK